MSKGKSVWKWPLISALFFLSVQVSYSDELFTFPLSVFNDEPIKGFLASHSDWKQKVDDLKKDVKAFNLAAQSLMSKKLHLSEQRNEAMQNGDYQRLAELVQQIVEVQQELDRSDVDLADLNTRYLNLWSEVSEAAKNQ